MKILVLEDDENRIAKFKSWFIGCNLYITHLADRANELIQEENFDMIFLDHDLEEDHYKTWQDPSIVHENTGYKTALFLENNPEYCKDAEIIIHSLNPYGSSKMAQALSTRNAKVYPFTILIQRLLQ